MEWIAANWFVLLQSAGIIGGLFFTGLALHREANAKRVANLITFTAHHRQLWQEFHRRPELRRVLDPKANIEDTPVTPEEERFVILLILHLHAAWHAVRNDLAVDVEGLRADIAAFFALPVPQAVWARHKPIHDQAFVRFVEECRAEW
jgi:hypothetical protein